MNCDGLFTISDLGLWLEWVIFFPGDDLFWALMTYWPDGANFFEITTDNYGGWFSGILSVVVWLIVLIGGSLLSEKYLD